MVMKNIQIEKSSVWILWLALASVFIIAALAEFKVIDLTPQTSSIMTIFGALFVLAEIGWFTAVRKGAKIVTYIGLVVVAITLLGSILSLANTGQEFNDAIAPIKGIVNILLVLYIIAVAFTSKKQI